ncbi:MAG: hypothetical protein AB7R89_24045 [Dehalococcoidia bacterium]
MTSGTTNAIDVRTLYLETLQGAMTRPARGDSGDALQGFLTLNAAYFLGEWLAQHTHTNLVQRVAARMDGIAGLQPPADETSALQLAQHARELVAAFGPTRWTDRIIRLTDDLVPTQPDDWDQPVRTALTTIAASGDGAPLLRAHARRRLWHLTNHDQSTADPASIPPGALSYAYEAAASDDGRKIQTAEAILAELAGGTEAGPSPGPSPR